jgi:outer membrane receptor protein involved in Fe transport
LTSLVGGAAIAAEIEEMVVTATKRVSTTHEVPISIEAFSGQSLEDYDITNLTELSTRVPNMSVGFGIATEAITIRGLGSGPERSFEQAVGLFTTVFTCLAAGNTRTRSSMSSASKSCAGRSTSYTA